MRPIRRGACPAVLLGSLTLASGCGKDDPAGTSAPASGLTRWVKTDLRTAGLASVRLAAARLASSCRPEAKRGIGVAVTGSVAMAANTHSLPDALATRLACALDAPKGATCDDVRACAGLASQRPALPQCDGQTLIAPAARSEGVISVACSAFGQSCFSTAIGGMCALEACSSGETYSCHGNEVRACVLGLVTATPCGQGMTCGEQEGTRMVDCVGTGPACSGADRCDGDIAVLCEKGTAGTGREAPVDCASWGLGCIMAGEHATCVPKASECAVGKDPARCKGGALEMCVAGKWWAVPCSSLAPGTKCQEGAGVSGEAGCQ